MKKKFVLAVLVSIIGSACGRTEAPAVQAQCDADADCTTLCDGYRHATCSVGGFCACGDPIPVAPQKCESNASCSCPEGYGSPLCGSDGICYCNFVQVVEVGSCASNSDCHCGESEGVCGQDGLCYCSQTVPAPTDCPAITRQEFVQRLYMAMGLECAKTSCTDLAGLSVSEYQAGCMWGALENAGVVASDGECKPGKTMFRAEVVKMMITAIDGLADYTAPATPTFTDVPTNAWYYDYVESAAQLGLTMGYLDASGNFTGQFGPEDPASTCWSGELIRNALSPTKTINVSLDPGTPNSAVVAKGATGIKLASFCFSGNNIPLSDLAVNRGGAGTANDWSSFRFVDESGSRVTSDFVLISDQGKDYIIFPFEVRIFGARCFTLVGDLSPTAGTGNQHFFYISSKWDVLADGYAVTGDFPVAGNTFTVDSLSVNTVTVSQGSASPDPQVNQLDAEVASFTLTADASSDLAFSKIKLNQAGNLNLWSLGDIRLYRGTDMLAGGYDQVKVEEGSVAFTLSIPFIIPAGQTKAFYVKADVLTGTAGGTIKLNLADNADVVVTDQRFGVGARVVNHFSATQAQTLTIVTSSNLSVSSEGNPEGGIVVAGTAMHLASKCQFKALGEGFNVDRLTVINDVVGPFDSPVNTAAISSVTIRYNDINNVMQVKTASLSSGSATFSGLSFYVRSDRDTVSLEIFANVSSMADVGETLSGKTFRLGILDTGNTVSTFEAVGAMSNTKTNSPIISNGATVNPFTVRKTKPTFAKIQGLSHDLVDGENTLDGDIVCADIAGPVSFARLPFDISSSAAIAVGPKGCTNYQLFRNSALITSVSLDSDRFGPTDNVIWVAAAFTQEEVVGAGSCVSYELRATCTGFMPNDTLAGNVNDYDEQGLPPSKPNTGCLYDPTPGVCWLDSTSDNFFSPGFPLGMSMLWSDNSAYSHQYPTISGNQFLSRGSSDWATGIGLGLGKLAAHTLSK